MKTVLFTTTMIAAMACQAGAAEFVSEKTHEFSAGSVQKVVVSTGSGDINYEVWDQPRIEVKILQSVKAKSEEKAEAIFNNTEVDIEESGGVLKVEVEHDSGGFWNSILSASPDVVVTVTGPSDLDAVANTGSGDVNIRGMTGEFKLNTGSGEIYGFELDGEIAASTGSGDVTLSGVRGTVSANTGSGDILVKNLEGELKGGTGSGDITASGDISLFKAGTGSGDVMVISAVALKDDCKVGTGSGDISVTLAPGTSFYLEAETNSGSLDCEFELANLETDEESLKGEANGSGPKLTLGAGSGDIMVAKIQ